jgi:hypothetical protein
LINLLETEFNLLSFRKKKNAVDTIAEAADKLTNAAPAGPYFDVKRR